LLQVKRKSNYLILATLSVIMALTWVGLGIYNRLTQPVDIKVSKKEMTPVKLNFDTQTLEAINQRLEISDDQLNQLEDQISQPQPTSEPETEAETGTSTPTAEHDTNNNSQNNQETN